MPNASRQQVATTLASLLTDLTTLSPDQLFGVDIAPDDALMGYFSQGAELFEFQITDAGQFSYVESGDRAAQSYLSGIQTLDSQEFRHDRFSKGKPCGKGFIPRGHQCRQGLSKPQKQSAQTAKDIVQGQKQSGNWKAGLLVGGAILGVGAAIVAASSTPSFQRPPAPNRRPPDQIASPPSPADSTALKSLLALNPAIDRVRRQNTTQPLTYPTLITPPTQSALVSDPRIGETAELSPRPEKIQQASSESTGPNPKAKTQKSPKTEIPANSKKKPAVRAESELEKQTESLIRQHGQYAASAKRVTDSRLTPAAIAQADQALTRLEVRHRQMLNPLHESYFGASAQEVRGLSKQLSLSNGEALNLKARLLKGKSVERHQQDSKRAIAELTDHEKRIRLAEAALGSEKKSKNRDRAADQLKQQRDRVQTLMGDTLIVQQALSDTAKLQPEIAALQQRAAALPTRPTQLDEQTQAQHRQIQRIRKLQGEMPTRVAQFARLHSDELNTLDNHIAKVDTLTGAHDASRLFGIQSVQGLIERRENLIEQDLHLLSLIEGKDGVKWVTSKDASEMPKGLELALKRAQAETGVQEIQTIAQAALFRQHIMGKLIKRIDGYAGDIEKRAAYPKEVSDRAVEQMNVQLADLHEFQKQAVIEGRQVSQGLVRDLTKTAQGVSVQLAGSAVQQPYRRAHEFLVADIQNAHAQKARAVAETIATSQDQRDRLTRISQDPAVFEVNGVFKSTEQLAQDVAEVRAKLKKSKALTTVKLAARNVKPTEEEARSISAREQRLAQNQVVKTQINHLQTQLGEVTQQIKKREEALARGQKKGTNTGKLEAQRAAIQQQMETLAQHFAGIEKRDRRDNQSQIASEVSNARFQSSRKLLPCLQARSRRLPCAAGLQP